MMVARIASLFNTALKTVRRKYQQGSNSQGDSEWNSIIDNVVSVMGVNGIESFCRSITLDFNEQIFWNWLRQTDLPFTSLKYPHKKALEFFFSSKLLDIEPFDHLLDAAGGRSGYLDAVRSTTGCQNLYLTDQINTGIYRDPSGTLVVGGDISVIELPDASVTKIACHHAFEHFQGDKDQAFIREIGRLLKAGGRACIVPLFLLTVYTECWNIDHKGLFDETAQLIIDKTASIPGGDDDGHFARFYDAIAFQQRILKTAEETALALTVVTCRLGGQDIPDMSRNFGSSLNRPLRALVLEKVT